jgi:hypothetical protein
VTRSRLSLLSLAAVLAAAALVMLAAGSAAAAGTKVLLVTRGEESEGPPAAMGEPAHVTNFINWGALSTFCGATDEGATVGKNPGETVKVRGSNAPLGSTGCFSFETGEAPGSVTVRGVSVSKTGAVALHGRLEVQTAGCHYRARKLTGTQGFEEGAQFSEILTGTATLVRGSAGTCAGTTTVEDLIGVADTAGFNYLAKLTS